jgi:hypothetical protein
MILLECIYCTGFDNVVKSLIPLNLPFLISVNMRLGSQLNMPQIQINGELREVSQAEYDALTTNGQASTPAAGSYEQYAAAIAKEQAVTKLADADANFETGTNVSPEFVALKDQIRSDATAAAGENAASYAERYAQEQRELYANGETNLAALREELSAPAPTTAPGTVGVQISEQQGTDGEIIGTLNTASPAPGQSVEPVLSEIVDASPAEVNPAVDPQVNLPADIAGAPDPTVAAYFQNKAELEAVQKTFAVEEGDRATFVANPEERAEFIARLEENNQRLEAELEQKGLLDAVQQAEEQDRIENAAAQPPIGSLAELYPDDEPVVVSEAEIEIEATTELTAEQTSADAEVSAFEEQQTPELVPASEIETEAATELTEEQTAADPEVTEPAAEEVPLAEIDTGPAPLTDAEIAEYRALTATKVNETGAKFQEPFVSDEAAAAEAAYFKENPEAVRAVIESPPPPTVESETEELDLTLEEVEQRVAETEADTELTAEEEAADPEIAPEDDFVLSAADIDSGEDLTVTDTGGVPTQTLADFTGEDTGGVPTQTLADLTVSDTGGVPTETLADIGGDTGVPFVQQDVFAEDVVEYFEDTPDDFGVSDADIDRGDDLTVSDTGGVPTQTLADFTGGDTGVPTQTLADLTVSDTGGVPTQSLADIGGDTGLLPSEAELQREAGAQIDAYSAVENSGDPTLTDEEIDAARADQQIEFGPDGLTTLSSAEAARQQSTLDRARAQYILQQQRKQANDGDWRVRLRLAPNAEYLYKSDQPGILQPLAVTDGVIFPYTPQITTAYKATYNSYNLTHSNYRGFFYQGSQMDDIQLNATFTAQDTAEANYLLAVIHFFRSVTKMFYGQDATSGAPPPLVFLQGLGEYQFNLAPCVVASFNYVLPADVDYIRAGSPNINGTNLLQRRDRQDLPTNPVSSAWTRINNVLKPQGIKKGAITSPPAPPTLGTNRPTYVPTKMEISIILHPMQSREQVSKQFSLKQYANGDLLKGGFW